MKVLLVSPVPGIDPPCGDVTYTQSLLADPPEGVVYETYVDAIKNGRLIEHGRRNRRKSEPLLTAGAKIINMLRARHVFFWEPFRFFSVAPDAYDLIHVHVFPCRFFNLATPLVNSNAIAIRYLYSDARHLSRPRVGGMELVEKSLAGMLGVDHLSYRHAQAQRSIAFTTFLKDWYVRHGVAQSDRIDVIPIYLRDPGERAPRNRKPHHIGFIAKDFDAKGGGDLLGAYDSVRAKNPGVRLTIVGCPPRLPEDQAKARGIRWIPYIPRETLLNEFLPSIDMLAYPTLFDGQPLVVMEAMSLGIPVITSDYQAMPEMVAHGSAGRIVPMGDIEKLAAAITGLLEPAENARCAAASRAHFLATYCAGAVRPRLLACYDQAMREWRAARRQVAPAVSPNAPITGAA